MRREIRTIVFILFLPGLLACTVSLPARPSSTPTKPEVMADTFFSGCAYLDENANGIIDPDDLLLGGMTYTVTLAGGAGFGAGTSDGGCASIIVPGGLSETAWPVQARMAIPDGDAYESIGPSQVTLEYPQTRAEFLFKEK